MPSNKRKRGGGGGKKGGSGGGGGRIRHKKIVIGWDESERADYLTGFRKRKQQRREQAIVEMVDKARKERLINRKELREKKATIVVSSDDSDSDGVNQVEKVSFTDEFSKERFGTGNVTITTVVGFDGDDSDDELELLKEKLQERKKHTKKKNLAAEEKRLAKSQELRVKRMKEIILKSKRKGPKKSGSKNKRRKGTKHSKGKRK
jgi:hypothetical protein